MHTADTQFVDWIDWFRDDLQPFALSDGRRAATNGYIAVIVSDGGRVEPLPNAKKGRADTIEKVLKGTPETTIEVEYANAVEVFAPCEHPATITCPDCKGTCKVDHECYCDLCETAYEDCGACWKGETETVPDNRYCSVLGKPFNANKIAYVFAHAPAASRATLAMHRVSDSNHLHIITPLWTAIVVGMIDSTLREHDCKEIIFAPLAASEAPA